MKNKQSDTVAKRLRPEMPESPNLLEDIGEAMILGIPGALPVVGSGISGMMAAGMNFSYKAKMYTVVNYVLEELEEISARLDRGIQVVAQDEQFNTYLTRAVWQAAETHEEEKLRALASAATNSGSWSPIKDAEREYYWRLLRQYTVLHLQTLRALHSPQIPEIGVEDEVRLEEFFRVTIGFPAFHEDIGDAVLSDLSRDGLIRSGFGRGYTFTAGSSDLSPLGGSFLDFVSTTHIGIRGLSEHHN